MSLKSQLAKERSQYSKTTPTWRLTQTMKHFWMIFVITALMLTACGSEPEPTMSPADVQSTAMAAAMTMVAETQAAVPTATPLPPTALPSATPLPSNTAPPLNIETATQAQTVSVFPTNTSAPASSGSNASRAGRKKGTPQSQSYWVLGCLPRR